MKSVCSFTSYGDGHSDILWRNTSGVNAVWEMNVSTIKPFFNLPTVDPSYQPVGTHNNVI